MSYGKEVEDFFHCLWWEEGAQMRIIPGVKREGLGRGRCLIQVWKAMVGSLNMEPAWSTFGEIK